MYNQHPEAGVNQLLKHEVREKIIVEGATWSLKRNASDPSIEFAHGKVGWLRAGCDPILGGQAWCCWIMGVIAPANGTIQLPVNVMYIGFHKQKINVSPDTLGPGDLDRMHLYTNSSWNFSDSFISQFLGAEQPTVPGAREPITAWPQGIEMPVAPAPVVEPKVSITKPPKEVENVPE